MNSKGELLKKESLHLYAMFAPGTIMAATFIDPKVDDNLEGDWGMWINYHHHHEWQQATDDQGRTTFSGLIPGLNYAIATFEGFDRRTGEPRLDFQVKPGEMLKLPDFVIKK